MTDTTAIPALAIAGANAMLYQPGTDRHVLRLHAYEVGQQHAAYAAAEAAAALRRLFGDVAYRAVFDRKSDLNDGVDATLLAVFDRGSNVLWYNRKTDLLGSELVEARDATGEPMPDIEADTLRYVEGLVEWAEEAHHDGYLLYTELITEPSIGQGGRYDGHVVELTIDDELAAPARLMGASAHDGSRRPQRAALSPEARDWAVLALQRVLESQKQIMTRITVDKQQEKLIREVIQALDPR